ncbi:transposase [Salmonella enterica subsp. enterica]|nr:transposase [Salmonella enterica subsp. enterica]
MCASSGTKANGRGGQWQLLTSFLSSKRCSCCGFFTMKKKCLLMFVNGSALECGTDHDRDVNAARITVKLPGWQC